MSSLENLTIIGVSRNAEGEQSNLERNIPHSYLNAWDTGNGISLTTLPIPYREGCRMGFNDLTMKCHYLLVADGESILGYNLIEPSRPPAQLRSVRDISSMLCKTPSYLISAMSNLIQIRPIESLLRYLDNYSSSAQEIEVPHNEIQHEGEGDTILALFPIPGLGEEYALLNNATDKSYLIDPQQGQCQPVRFSSKQQFPYTFQRREQFHFITTEPSKHLVFTESTSDDQQQNRVYSLDIRGPPTITELEPLELEDRQILSMLPAQNDQLTLLTNYNDLSHLETLDSKNRRILNSQPLTRKYDLGDRLQQVGDNLLIVRHLENEIVDAQTEESIKLTGAENDIPIPEISSTWDVPQFLYVAQLPSTTR